MKNFIAVALFSFFSLNAFADCTILVKHNLTYTILDELKKALPESVNVQRSGEADFGITDVTGTIDTGRVDVFGTRVRVASDTYHIYDRGKVVFTSKPYHFSSNLKTLATQLKSAANEVSNALDKLGCN